jgi:hypothetical protein
MGTAIVEEDKQMVYNRNIILQEEIQSEYNNTIQMKMKKEKKRKAGNTKHRISLTFSLLS